MLKLTKVYIVEFSNCYRSETLGVFLDKEKAIDYQKSIKVHETEKVECLEAHLSQIVID